MPLDLSVKLGPLELASPLMTASGCSGYGKELDRYHDLSVYGALVGKSISRNPRLGNPYPRTAETAAGMINAIGLQNEGFDSFVKETLPKMRGFGPKAVVNIVGHDFDEYVWLTERFDAEPGIAALELNLSCPNVAGGMRFATDAAECEKLVRACREKTRLPVIAKLSPNVTDVCEIARAAEAAGADILCAINTLVGMAVDWRARKPLVANVTGGLSGPAVKPVALRIVHQVSRAVKIPVIGIGGISNADDVLDFMVSGASAVQLGTILFVEPDAGQTIYNGLKSRLLDAGVQRIADIVGTLETGR
ncbi:MAG: dihydroorotate dehydrogenase [Planctomycetes bacterium]|nr:dihydroorotate dehydrogenase [Planctomycetota bacterium]MCW8137261.1 dihydroorotate dehydrogenase [Planctomycetota bacterium]